MSQRKPYPSETAERFIVRFPDGMRDQIQDLAHRNNRSMNAEIVARLRDSIDLEPAAPKGIINKAIHESRGDYKETTLKQLVERVKRLPPDKQAALLKLLQDAPSDK